MIGVVRGRLENDIEFAWSVTGVREQLLGFLDLLGTIFERSVVRG